MARIRLSGHRWNQCQVPRGTHNRSPALVSTETTGPAGEAGLLEAARALALTIHALARGAEARRAVAEAGP